MKTFREYVKKQIDEICMKNHPKKVLNFENFVKEMEPAKRQQIKSMNERLNPANANTKFVNMLNEKECVSAHDFSCEVGSYFERETLVDLYGEKMGEIFDMMDENTLFYSSNEGTFWMRMIDSLVRIS